MAIYPIWVSAMGVIVAFGLAFVPENLLDAAWAGLMAIFVSVGQS